MVRPGRRVFLAGARPVRVSAGGPLARRGRPQRGVKAVEKMGARKRAATSSERCSHVIFSAERCLKGRAGHVSAKATDSSLDRNDCWSFLVADRSTFPKKNVEQDRPCLAAWPDEPRGYKGQMAEVSTAEGVRDTALEAGDLL
jgi:hypothetical protein